VTGIRIRRRGRKRKRKRRRRRGKDKASGWQVIILFFKVLIM
jgi:hypothetical protein